MDEDDSQALGIVGLKAFDHKFDGPIVLDHELRDS